MVALDQVNTLGEGGQGIASALAVTPLTKNRRVRRAIDQVDRGHFKVCVLGVFRWRLCCCISCHLHLWVFILLGHHSHSMDHNAGGSGHTIPPAAPPPPQRR